MVICILYLVLLQEEPRWRHAGGGVLFFVFPALLDYRVRRSLKYMLFGIRPENTKRHYYHYDNDDNDNNMIDHALLFQWMGKYVQMPIELAPAIVYALAHQEQEEEEQDDNANPTTLLFDPKAVIAIVSMVLTISLLGVGIISRIRPGTCWISHHRGGAGNKQVLHIPVNASEAELSYAGYLAALDDEDYGGVVYVASGDVSEDIPILLRWIDYSGLPPAGRWGEVLGHGDSETGAELLVEKCFGKSILYECSLGSTMYIQLGNKVFEIRGGFAEAMTPSPSLRILDHAKPVTGSWEVI